MMIGMEDYIVLPAPDWHWIAGGGVVLLIGGVILFFVIRRYSR
jgi:hypothetical protein